MIDTDLWCMVWQVIQRSYFIPIMNRRPAQSPLETFIDSLINPPALNNPLRRTASQTSLNDSLLLHRDITASDSITPRLSPMKKKSQSSDKVSPVFSNTRNYFQQISAENSVNLSSGFETPLTSKLTQGPTVRFRQNLLMMNSHNKRPLPQEMQRQSRTPSILKRSRMMRNQSQNIINNALINRNTNPVAMQRQARTIKTNQVIRKRYFAILQRYQAKFQAKVRKGIKLRNDQKYKDELFPPTISSIFKGGVVKNKNYAANDIRWLRLGQLYKNKQLCVYGEGYCALDVFCYGIDVVGQAFNCIKHNRHLLGQMFEWTQASPYGVYLIKIFQQNVWKYVIVDDLIPVVTNQEGFLEPLFMNIAQEEGQGANQKPLEIWPFLLEKAYANYYANYDTLHYGNTLDFLEEITGMPSQTLNYVPNTTTIQAHQKLMEQYFNKNTAIFLGYNQQMNLYYPIQRNKRGKWGARLQKQKLEKTPINRQDVFDYFDCVYLLDSNRFGQTSVSPVGTSITRNHTATGRFDISLKTLKIDIKGEVGLFLRQKQKRFYQNSNLNYNYIWVRVILLQKQPAGDYRWITSSYSNSKSINITKVLQVGEYVVVVMPQWKSSHCYQISLIAMGTSLSIFRKDWNQNQRVVQKGCADLAQRMGRLNQINLYACSYTLIDKQTALLIENINNQRINGDIRINRSIAGLKPAVELIPFNVQFYQLRNKGVPYKQQISVHIQNQSSYTVVLMMRGGVDREFLNWFDFGK